MKHEVSCKLGLGFGVALLLMSGCAAPETANEGMGTARVRIEAVRTQAFEITQVTVTAQGGFEADLVRDPSGAFVGTLLLPAGPNELVGEAFVGPDLVGVSTPVPVEIQAGLVTSATIRILDITGGEDIGHRPIILSLTHPMSALSNQPVELAVSFVEPDNQDVDITWLTDCADAALSSPELPSTSFTKPSPGTCAVSVTVSDGVFSAGESFNLVVFDQEQGEGAVEIGGEFVSAPQLFMELRLPTSVCTLSSDSQDGTCDGSIAAPERAFLHAFVNWGNAVPGSFEVTDSGCGGSFGRVINDPFFFQGEWQPPTSETVCLITARAISGEGLQGQLSAAVLVRAGQAGPPALPRVSVTMNHPDGSCQATSEQGDVFCGPVRAGSPVDVFGQVDWGPLGPGTIGLGATCDGEVVFLGSDGFSFQGFWRPPLGDTQCTFIVSAIPREGLERSARLVFQLGGGDPPPPPPPPPPPR
jgi:hypothetical protein